MATRILLLTRMFGEKDHAEAFLHRHIRAGTLGSYRETEDPARGDPQEGILSSAKNRKVTLGTSRGSYTFSHEAGERLEMRFHWTDRANVLCSVASYIDTEWVVPGDRVDEVADRYVRIPESAKKFGDFEVLVNRPHRFLDRAAAAAEKAGLELSYGLVDYSGRVPNPTNEELLFCKGNEFKAEREFRLAFFSSRKVERPLTLEIDDLSDIARLVGTQKITGTRMTVTPTTMRGPAKDTPESLTWKDDL